MTVIHKASMLYTWCVETVYNNDLCGRSGVSAVEISTIKVNSIFAAAKFLLFS